MIIQHNMAALMAQQHLTINGKEKDNIGAKLSSGYRINKAADNAAGLSISEKMRAQIRGLDQASINVQDGISLVQTADGAMSEVHSILQRVRELTVQAKNDTNTTEDREAMQEEISGLTFEIEQIAESTEFNLQKILQGTDAITYYDAGEIPAWVSMPTGLTVNNLDVDGSTLQNTSHTLVTDSGTETVWTGSLSDNASAVIDFSSIGNPSALENLNALIGTGFYSTCCTCSDQYSICFSENNTVPDDIYGYPTVINISDLIDAAENNTMTDAQIGEALVTKIITIANNQYSHFTEYEKDASNPLKLVIYDWRDGRTPGASYYGQVVNHITYMEKQGDLNIQVGANKEQSIQIELPKINLQALRLQFGYNDYYGVVDVDKTITTYPDIVFGVDANGESIVVSWGQPHVDNIHMESNGTLDDVDYAIAYISNERSKMGSYQNRLEHIYDNDINTSENLQAAESRIRDADMAELSVLFLKHDILMQTGQSILAQANQYTESVLSLLK